MGDLGPLETRPSPLCYHAEYIHCRSNHVGVARASQKYLECCCPTPWYGDMADTLETLLSKCITVPNLFVLCQIVWAQVGVPKIGVL